MENADTVIILSSELIARVMEVHFNKKMFKQQVKIVDLEPTTSGYMFSLSFETPHDKIRLRPAPSAPLTEEEKRLVLTGSQPRRDNKGRFSHAKTPQT